MQKKFIIQPKNSKNIRNFYHFRFGDNSIEVGHELVKYTDVLFSELQDSTKRISCYQDKVHEAKTCLEKAAQIFELHYGTWNITYKEIIQRLDKISFFGSTDIQSM